MTGTSEAPITATFHDDDTVAVQASDQHVSFRHHPDAAARDQALQWLVQRAGAADESLRVTTSTPGLVLLVHPDGTYADEREPALTHEVPSVAPRPERVASPDGSGADGATPGAGDRSALEDTGPQPPITEVPTAGQAAPAAPAGEAPSGPRAPAPPPTEPEASPAPAPRRQSEPSAPSAPGEETPAAPTGLPSRAERASFITHRVGEEPANEGWRGGLNRRLGLRLAPGAAERIERADTAAVSQHWPGPRTIAVANPKGSANKTPTAVMLSAVFARYGGAGVLAWDNNETRGSLPWRTQQANHTSTVLDLLPQVADLLATNAQSAQMSHWVHHQPTDKYDVLWSDQSVAGDHVVTSEDVERVWQVAARYYRMLVVDSGNSERAPNWRSMIEHAHCLVVPCTNVEDTPEAGALMLEALASRDEHSRRLADNAVAVVSQRTPGKDSNTERIVRDLTPLVREVVQIPYDPALKTGLIQFDALRPATQRAWLRAAAAVANGL